MRLGTMTSLFRERREGGEHIGYIESMRRIHDAGFRVLDMNLCALTRRETRLHLDGWEREVDAIRNEAEILGMEFSQCHPPYITNRAALFEREEDERFFHDMSLRSLQICATLGVRWAVLHPVRELADHTVDREALIRRNHEFYAPEIELADRLNVGLAFENMGADHANFACNADDLIALADSFRSDKIAVCWDTGHAHTAMGSQTDDILKLGTRIKALHIDDNRGRDDLHDLPFEGTICWEDVMHALHEGGCDADLIYEIVTCKNMPDAIKDLTARYCFDVGQYLLSLYR